MKLNVEQIRMDGGTQPREKINEEAVDSYIEALRRCATFPPIDVCFDGSIYWLVDGFHRLTAYHRLDIPAIEATVHQGTQADAQWMSCGVNDANGLFRSNEDKRRAVRVALAHPKSRGMSNPQIAAHCRVSDEFVREMRRKFQPPEPGEKRLGADGKSYPASIASPSQPSPASHTQAATQASDHGTRAGNPTIPTTPPPPVNDALQPQLDRYAHLNLPLDGAKLAASILVDELGDDYARQVINEAQEILWPEAQPSPAHDEELLSLPN